MKPIEISTTGKAVATNGAVVDFTESLFQQSVEAYNPDLSEAPLVIGHPKSDAPSYGWVKSLQFSENVLIAEPHQVDVQFSEMVKDGRFKKRSASFYTPNSVNNPVPGVYYLRHVAFLGAEPPSIKGLKDVQFSDNDDDVITVEFSEASGKTATTDGSTINRLAQLLSKFFIPLEAQADFSETSQTNIPQSVTTQIQETEMPDEENSVDFAEQRAQLDRQAAALEQREQKLMRREHEDFAESLVTAGRVLPGQKSGLVEFMSAITADQTLEFSEDDAQVEKPAIDWFKSFMEKQPVQVDFSELATDNEDDASVEFSTPAGTVVSKDRLALHQKAITYQSKNNCDYATAVHAVGGK